MKQLLFLLLFPCLALAQYQGNANQKITLGEQTTADGLVWRGRLADTANLLTNKLDTSVYIVLDTATRAMWYYRASTTPKWTRLVDSLNNLQGQLSLTTKVTGTLPVANGGTNITTFTAANRIPYSSSATALTTSENFTYDGLRLALKKSNNFSMFIGSAAGNLNAGDDNICIGYLSGYKIKSNGAGNTFIGTQSGFSDSISGIYNSGIGYASLYSLNTGNYNLAIGANSLFYVTTGSSNIGIGNNSGGTLSTGSNNVYIGDGTNRSSTSVTNEIVLGVNATGQGSNSIMLGNSSITNAYCYDNTFSTPSDFRDKTNIENLNTGLDLILNLRPVKFQWNMRDYGKVGYKDIGFIAQEALDVQNINNEADNIKLVNDENQNQLSMQSGNLIPILVKAMQEQQAQIEALKQRLLILENK